MLIKKTSQTTSTQAQIVNSYNTSQTDSYSCNYINSIKDIYSTTEVLTNKIWIDKNNVEYPIYRRIVYCNGIYGDSVEILHGISDLKVVTFCESNANYESNNWLGNNGGAHPLQINRIDSTKIYAKVSSGFDSNWDVPITIEYTKTTDEPPQSNGGNN